MSEVSERITDLLGSLAGDRVDMTGREFKFQASGTVLLLWKFAIMLILIDSREIRRCSCVLNHVNTISTL